MELDQMRVLGIDAIDFEFINKVKEYRSELGIRRRLFNLNGSIQIDSTVLTGLESLGPCHRAMDLC